MTKILIDEAALRLAFERWWYDEGSSAPKPNDDMYEHCKQMCEIAWSNGAYKALEQPAQQDIPDLIAGALGVSRGTAYDLMREALAEQPAQQEPVAWISVKDRLPPVGEDVLTYDVAYPEDGVDCECRLGLDKWSVKYSVSHWMPLPAPPIEAALGITKGNT